MRRRAGRLSALAAAVALAACTVPGEDRTASPVREVKIGILAPLTDATLAGRADALRGAQLAVDLVNGRHGSIPLPPAAVAGLPGLGGAKLSLVAADTRRQPQRGAAEAARLVTQERVAAVVGASDPPVTAVASQRTERIGVPFVNGDISAGYLTERGLDWFFRTGPTDRIFGEALFSVLRQPGVLGRQGAPARRIAILYANDKAGNAARVATQELAEEGGLTVAAQVPFDPGTPDLGSAVATLAGMRPDAVFLLASSGTDASSAVRAALRAGATLIMASGAGFSDPAAVAAAGQGGGRVFRAVAWSAGLARRHPAGRPVADRYQQRFGAPMTEAAAGAFTAVLTLAAAFDRARAVEPQRVRAALLDLDVPGRDTIMPWDGVRFDATHQNARAGAVVEELLGGGPRVVFPAELAPA